LEPGGLGNCHPPEFAKSNQVWTSGYNSLLASWASW
jgi:hypothetical protein